MAHQSGDETRYVPGGFMVRPHLLGGTNLTAIPGGRMAAKNVTMPSTTPDLSHSMQFPPGYTLQSEYSPQGNIQSGNIVHPPQQNFAQCEAGADKESEYGQPEFQFSEKSIRHGFLRKVFSILMVQLLVTIAIILGCSYYREEVMHFLEQHIWILLIPTVTVLVTLLMMMCCSSIMRVAPCNLILLGLFTVAMSSLVAVGALRYETNLLLMALGTTMAVVLVLTLFALQTKLDFTCCGALLLCLLTVGITVGVMAIWLRSEGIKLVYMTAVVLVYSLFLVIDTQLMVGGEHKYSISPEDYVFAALCLYLDIIHLFIYILRCLSYFR